MTTAKQKSIRHGGARRRNPVTTGRLVDAIRPGDRVTIVDRFGKEHSGRVVMRSSHGGWVLNMGGKYGTPGLADDSNITRVTPARRRNPSGEAHYEEALRDKNPIKLRSKQPGNRAGKPYYIQYRRGTQWITRAIVSGTKAEATRYAKKFARQFPHVPVRVFQ